MRTRLAGLLGVLLTITACSGGAEIVTSTSTTPSATSTTATLTMTSTPAPTTTVAVTTTTAFPIDVTVSTGEVAGPGRFGFELGEQVSVWVLSDIDDEIHVHGYDRYFEALAGVPVEVVLTADVPGIFEVELESSHIPLFELEVTP
ncbi:MAG TPA: hypothetical protein VK990_08530 [Acidimicrobiia bacterium]|nr:hypothetical protein [Acidimicrobiia bacterium]